MLLSQSVSQDLLQPQQWCCRGLQSAQEGCAAGDPQATSLHCSRKEHAGQSLLLPAREGAHITVGWDRESPTCCLCP